MIQQSFISILKEKVGLEHIMIYYPQVGENTRIMQNSRVMQDMMEAIKSMPSLDTLKTFFWVDDKQDFHKVTVSLLDCLLITPIKFISVHHSMQQREG